MTLIVDPDKGVRRSGEVIIPDRCPDCNNDAPPITNFTPQSLGPRCWDKSGMRHAPAGRKAVVCWGCVHARCRECLIDEANNTSG